MLIEKQNIYIYIYKVILNNKETKSYCSSVIIMRILLSQSSSIFLISFYFKFQQFK